MRGIVLRRHRDVQRRPGTGLRDASDTVTGCASPSFPPIHPGVAAWPPSPPTSCTRSTRPIGPCVRTSPRSMNGTWFGPTAARFAGASPRAPPRATRAPLGRSRPPTSMSSASSTSSGSTGSGTTRAGRANAGSKAPTRITSPRSSRRSPSPRSSRCTPCSRSPRPPSAPPCGRSPRPPTAWWSWPSRPSASWTRSTACAPPCRSSSTACRTSNPRAGAA